MTFEDIAREPIGVTNDPMKPISYDGHGAPLYQYQAEQLATAGNLDIHEATRVVIEAVDKFNLREAHDNG